MINNNKVLTIIPARGGSKGIFGKNIIDFCGKPLIAWTIDEALKSSYIDLVIVSTDDPLIASVSEKYGAKVPFTRPKELATDTATSSSVILHALEWFSKNEKTEYPVFILLQPTSPLRNYKHIDEALEIFVKHPEAKSLVSVREVIDHPAWMKIINAGNFLENYEKEDNYITRRQDLPGLYMLNGAVYIMRSEDFRKDKTFFVPECFPYIMDEKTSIDIDSKLDLKLAEIIKKEE